MGVFDKPEEFAGAWVSGEIGNGVGPEIGGEYDPSEPRPSQEDINDRIKGLTDWRLNNKDQRSYQEWWQLWKQWAEGSKRPGMGTHLEGWTQEDFQAVFLKIPKPE